MNEVQTFLGEGWSFPPHFDRKTGTLVTTTAVVDINKSLEELLFQPLDLTLKTYIKDLIKTAILYHEPRIDVQKITLDSTNELEGEILINIDYIVRITNSRANMVFPFYKKEGSEI